MDVKPSCLNSQRAALSGNMQMMQPFLLDRINLWGYSYPLGGLRVQCRWHSQRLGCRLLLPMGRGKSQWLGGIQWRMCGLPSSTWQFLWGRWFGLRLCASCPPAPRWIYAAPLKQQRSVQSTPGANAVPKVVAVNVRAPQATKDNPLIEGRVPTDKGVETIKPSDFKSMWGWNLFELFAWFTFFPLYFLCI